MHKALSVLYFLLLAISSIFPANLKEDYLSVFADSYSYIDSLENRTEGSDGEDLVFEYIKNFLADRDLDFEEQPLNDIEDHHSFSQNIIVRIPGILDDELIIAASVDSSSPDDDSALNPALALSFINEWASDTPPVTLKFLFTSGDNVRRGFLGTVNFLNNYRFGSPAALIYLNLDTRSSIPALTGGSEGLNSPGWYMEEHRQAFHTAGIEYRIDGTALLINRAGLSTERLPIGHFLAEDIPSVFLSSSALEGPDLSLNLAPWLQYLHSFLDMQRNGIPESWDNHYVYLGYDRNIIAYIPEKTILVIYIVIISLSLLFPIFQERRITLNFRKFRKSLWTVPVIIYLCFLFFMLTTLMIEELLLFLNYSFIWQYYPIYFFILKALSAILLSSVFINLMRGLPFPRNPHFYSYVAFTSSLLNLIIVSFINISFSPAMLISLVLVFLFVTIRNKTMKQILMFASIVPQFLFLIFLFQREYTAVYEYFILSRITGNWLLTFFALPFISQLSSLSFYHHHYDRSRQEAKTALFTLALAVITLSMVYFSGQLDPYARGYRQVLEMEDLIDLNRETREISLESSDPIGSGRIIYNNRTIPLADTGRSLRIQGEMIESSLNISWKTREFLDRRLIDLIIESPLAPEELEIQINSVKPLVIYDCPYPYEIMPDLRSARIFIGLNPPMPLEIPIVFSKDSAPDLNITAYKNNSDYELELEQQDMDIRKKTLITRTLDFNMFISEEE